MREQASYDEKNVCFVQDSELGIVIVADNEHFANTRFQRDTSTFE